MKSKDVMAMEFLPINNNGGQGYGFTLYQTELDSLPKSIEIYKVADRAQASNINGYNPENVFTYPTGWACTSNQVIIGIIRL